MITPLLLTWKRIWCICSGQTTTLTVQYCVRPRKQLSAYAINHTNYSPLIKIKNKENKTCWEPKGRVLLS